MNKYPLFQTTIYIYPSKSEIHACNIKWYRKSFKTFTNLDPSKATGLDEIPARIYASHFISF